MCPVEHAALCSLRARWARAELHTGAPPLPQSCRGLWDCAWNTAKLLTGFSPTPSEAAGSRKVSTAKSAGWVGAGALGPRL